jgi:hypothetical protein
MPQIDISEETFKQLSEVTVHRVRLSKSPKKTGLFHRVTTFRRLATEKHRKYL